MAGDFERVTLCSDGKYRWVYEKDLYHDLSVLFLVIKIFGAISVFMGFFILVLDRDVKAALFLTGTMFLVMAVLSVIGYFVYALMMGGSYCVTFTMDERGVEHAQHANRWRRLRRSRVSRYSPAPSPGTPRPPASVWRSAPACTASSAG